jgi:hypothetical protein
MSRNYFSHKQLKNKPIANAELPKATYSSFP